MTLVAEDWWAWPPGATLKYSPSSGVAGRTWEFGIPFPSRLMGKHQTVAEKSFRTGANWRQYWQVGCMRNSTTFQSCGLTPPVTQRIPEPGDVS
ncbi:hypothetical protein KCP74_25560 (plasmid) [Salmonella enterica subsp. enterica]|nr:hypothetical protein KCP74_25560 [Salmonella enterica subsp. enterica]